MYVFYDCMTLESNPDSFVSIKYLSIYLSISVHLKCVASEDDGYLCKYMKMYRNIKGFQWKDFCDSAKPADIFA